MTEAEWLACPSPRDSMLAFLQGKVSDRKMRLFACACVRQVWEHLTDPDSRFAVEVAERAADGECPADEVRAAGQAAMLARTRTEREADLLKQGTDRVAHCRAEQVCSAAYAAGYLLQYTAGPRPLLDWVAPTTTASACVFAYGASADLGPLATEQTSRALWWVKRDMVYIGQAQLLRDVVGNPFRPVTAWPRWRSLTVEALARSVYAARAFDRLPVLADALEEAGCDDAEVLSHCRGDGPHVRGCRVLDAVLGKS